MNFSQRPESFETADYLRTLRRRWWIVLGLLLLGGVAAAAYVKVAPKIYTATAEVYVTANGASANQVQGGRTSGSVNMDSEAQVVQSAAVATIAAHLLHTSVPPATLSKDVSVAVPPNSQDLQISCHVKGPKNAAACAQAFARAYLQSRTTTAINALRAQRATLQAQLTSQTQTVATLTQRVSALPPNSSARATAEAQLASARSSLNSLSTQVAGIAGQMANTNGGQIISPAVTPTSPTSPRKLLVLPSGAAAGLVLGLILAFAADARDRRVHGPRDLERRIDLPVLLNVDPARRGAEAGVATTRSRVGQEYAELAHQTSAALGDGNHVVLVASSSRGSGASVVAANLAVAFTRTHAQVVLVCADLETSAVPALLRLTGDRGLADVLTGAATLGEAMQRPADFPRLRVLPPGLETSLLASDFQYETIQRLVSELRRSTPVVIIEVPPATVDGDAFAMAEFADAALVVVETGKTQWPEAEDCAKRLDRLRTMVLGAVLIPPVPRGDRLRQADQVARLVSGTRRPAEIAPAAPPGGVPGEPAGRPNGKQPKPTSWAWEEPADKGARS
jgi:capsular polysaccharide biosynthesis protein/MinD-like ATPase involved in chromosome partitioning or flagellar assembly